MLVTDAADATSLVKTLVVKAEDARALDDMEAMKRAYRQLHELNRDLLSEQTKRATNHAQLLGALKDVNSMIQKASRLRVGQAKTNVVTVCRNAVKNNNVGALLKILQGGSAAA
ncbi:unnamed protein product [Ostreobium quekettii]|uniref:Uncharacterized protein n=1 Tax=Ostreobium quekettii TaxID=121088 RepID=A0A8S1J6G2_9CHLO|nr:unnamed protein product [Ostreobium quekettii]|eukprot:evm.model.scf_1408EXC.2 EVM.evm.TU.scf_1408EXC.2   scf_1408EXC:7279-7620(+)